MLELLRADGYEDLATDGSRTVFVDITDLANFAKEAKSPRIFAAVSSHSRFVLRGASEIQVLVSTALWQKVSHMTFQDEPMQEMSTVMRGMERRVRSIEST